MINPTPLIKTFLFSLFILYSVKSDGQFTQQLRGKVVDQTLQSPLSGATVSIAGLSKSVITDQDGRFTFPAIPVGLYQLQVSFIGYKDITLDNIIVNSGKQTIVNASMDMHITPEKEFVVTANSRKNKPLNEMSAVSARAFTVEETQKYAAAVNDPLRMATGFAGVVAANDGNNDIVIRGNSPSGLLWRMEGIDIPNPNHFSEPNSSGGGISILSAQLLSNSDFITGAFAAEYGNALSGVFDLKLRKGNNDHHEYTLQAGLLGLNAAAEGPFRKGYNGSFLVNYRYSSLELLDKLGLNLSEGSTNFQDLCYNIYLPTKRAGEFTVFGFGGLSGEKQKAKKDSTNWKGDNGRYSSTFLANTGASGITHQIMVGSHTSLRSAVASSYNKNGYEEEYLEDDYSATLRFKENDQTKKWVLSSVLNTKVNKRNTIRAGAYVNFIHFDYYQLASETPDDPLKEQINTKGKTQTIQAFTQWQFKPQDRFTINSGVHVIELLYNHSYAIEPRASIKWELNRDNSIAFAYGLHSQVQGYGVYFAQEILPGGGISFPNGDLGLTRAHHFVVSHQLALSANTKLKTELYYQNLFNVPVSADQLNSFSVLNIQGGYVTQALANKGKGRNYGVEISLEKYLSNNLYYTINNSFYQSKYTASDGIERNTRFNGNHVTSIIAGKDFVSRDHLKTFGVHIKTIYAGGFRTTPIDLEQSREKGYTVFREEEAYSMQNPDYFRTDLRVSMKWNRKHLTSTLSLDIQNVTNRLNVYNQWYDKVKQEVVYTYQNGLIPVLNYKVEF